MPAAVCDENLLACSLGPLFFLDLRVVVSPTVTCSDAFPHGGSVCSSRGLTPLGEAAALQAGQAFWNASSKEVVVFSGFDGIGGAFRA